MRFLTNPFLVGIYGIFFVRAIAASLPSETILFTSPEYDFAQWKEISRHVTQKEGVIEYIPSNQHRSNWSDLLCIQYFDRSLITKEASKSVENMIQSIRESTLAAYPGGRVTWKTIATNRADFLYEWILHEPRGKFAPEQEISRAFVTDTGFYRIGFTKRNQARSQEEREKCIRSLRDFVSVVSISVAKKEAQGLSVVDRGK